MNSFCKAGTLAVFCMLVMLNASATKRKVLFIGNSYTYTNNMPLMLQTLATAQGDTMTYDESDPGGYTFEQHCTNATTIAKIFSQQWDIVVLQEQSERPAFPPDQVDSEVYPYAHKLDSMIHANNSCTQTMFMMTWGHADGDPPNCAFYPAICTYDGMQQRLRESYMQMTQDNHAIVAPVGVAWKSVMDSIPSIWLYMTDSIHPVVPGSYLESCVLYSSIFHKQTLGCSYTSGLSATVANTLQRIADRVVFDSLTQWQQYGHYPYAGFSAAAAGSTVTFTHNSAIGAAAYWSFGDGNHDTTADATHTYAAHGAYAVSHTVTTSCFTETLTDTVRLGTTAVPAMAAQAGGLTILHQGNGKVTFVLPVATAYDRLEVFYATGRCVKKYETGGVKITDTFVPGLYIYRAYAADGSSMLNGKMVVY